MKIVKDIEVKLGDYALINMAYKNVIFTSEYFLQSVFLENCIFIDCDFSQLQNKANYFIFQDKNIIKSCNFENLDIKIMKNSVLKIIDCSFNILSFFSINKSSQIYIDNSKFKEIEILEIGDDFKFVNHVNVSNLTVTDRVHYEGLAFEHKEGGLKKFTELIRKINTKEIFIEEFSLFLGRHYPDISWFFHELSNSFSSIFFKGGNIRFSEIENVDFSKFRFEDFYFTDSAIRNCDFSKAQTYGLTFHGVIAKDIKTRKKVIEYETMNRDFDSYV